VSNYIDQPPPDPKAQQQALSKLSHILWDIQSKQFKATKSCSMLTLAVDEMANVFPVSKLPNNLNGFNLVLTGGRH